jgi:hypothetical protein
MRVLSLDRCTQSSTWQLLYSTQRSAVTVHNNIDARELPFLVTTGMHRPNGRNSGIISFTFVPDVTIHTKVDSVRSYLTAL